MGMSLKRVEHAFLETHEYSLRDLNPSFGRERAASLTGLDEGSS